jgi:hypothetical protein
LRARRGVSSVVVGFPARDICAPAVRDFRHERCRSRFGWCAHVQQRSIICGRNSLVSLFELDKLPATTAWGGENGETSSVNDLRMREKKEVTHVAQTYRGKRARFDAALGLTPVLPACASSVSV